MDRRSFIRLAVAGSATGIIAPQVVLGAAHGGPLKGNMAGGIFYTKESPGRWAKKAGPHLPSISKSSGKGGTIIDVVTGHPMKKFDHYIVKHMILDKDFNFMTEHFFNPLTDKAATSQFNVKDYSGALYALSVCNKHDSWLNVIEV